MNTIAINSQKAKSNNKVKVHRFEVFKGRTNEMGIVEKTTIVGHSTLYEGSSTYSVYLRTLLKDIFYLLPEESEERPHDFVILTREPSMIEGKKYFWNRVGTGKLLSNENAGLMKLEFDLFDNVELYLNYHNATVKELDSNSNPAA